MDYEAAAQRVMTAEQAAQSLQRARVLVIIQQMGEKYCCHPENRAKHKREISREQAALREAAERNRELDRGGSVARLVAGRRK